VVPEVLERLREGRQRAPLYAVQRGRGWVSRGPLRLLTSLLAFRYPRETPTSTVSLRRVSLRRPTPCGAGHTTRLTCTGEGGDARCAGGKGEGVVRSGSAL